MRFFAHVKYTSAAHSPRITTAGTGSGASR
jgi:hypothetical protein